MYNKLLNKSILGWMILSRGISSHPSTVYILPLKYKFFNRRILKDFLICQKKNPVQKEMNIRCIEHCHNCFCVESFSTQIVQILLICKFSNASAKRKPTQCALLSMQDHSIFSASFEHIFTIW